MFNNVDELEEQVNQALSIINGDKELLEKLYDKLCMAINFNWTLKFSSKYESLLDKVQELIDE